MASHSVRTPQRPRKAAARFANAVSMYSAGIKVAFGTAFLDALRAVTPGADRTLADLSAQSAADLRREACDLEALAVASAIPCDPRHKGQLVTLQRALAALSGSGVTEAPDPRLPDAAPMGPGALVPFAHTSHMCLAALGAGWEMRECLQLWSQVNLGSFSSNGKSFFPGPRTPQSTPRSWSSIEVRSPLPAPGEHLASVHGNHSNHLRSPPANLGPLSGQSVFPLRPAQPPLLHRSPS